MKSHVKALMAMVVAMTGVLSSKAELLLYEGFDYAPGVSLHGLSPGGGRTWENLHDNGANVVATEGLSFVAAGYTGYEASGRAGIVSGANAAIGAYSYASLDIPNFSTPSTFYHSFLVRRVAGASSFDGNGMRPSGPYGAFVAGVFAGDAASWTLEAYNQPTNTYPLAATGIPATAGETFFLVLRWTIAGDWNHTVDLAVNPAFGDEPTSWDATVNFQRSISFSIWRLITAQGDNSVIYDEMRVATTWADALPLAAVPEPSAAAALAGLGALGLVARRRRRGCAG